MPIKFGQIQIDRAALKEAIQAYPEVDAKYKLQILSTGVETTMLYPATVDGKTPAHGRFVAGIDLVVGPELVQQHGQIVITSSRVLGLITEGAVKSTGKPLNENLGSVFAFSIAFDDVRAIEPLPNWRGKPIGVRILSQDDALSVHIFSVVAYVDTEGTVLRATTAQLIDKLQPGGRPGTT